MKTIEAMHERKVKVFVGLGGNVRAPRWLVLLRGRRSHPNQLVAGIEFRVGW